MDTLIDALAELGWVEQADFLSPALTRELAEECRRRAANGQLTPAGIGRGDAQQVREGIRGDHTDWLEPGQTAACDRYLALMDELRQQLNRQLYLGLEDFECHFALYPPSTFYQRHLDRFRDDDLRTVSAVIYLNEDWHDTDGGQLRLYLNDGEGGERALDVQPQGGRLACFLSANVPHEVLPASRERLSLTGWFRRRPADPLAR